MATSKRPIFSSQIVTLPDRVLRERSKAVTDFETPFLTSLQGALIEAMYLSKGIGCAAPQIGIAERVAVVSGKTWDSPAFNLLMVNPEII